MANLMVIEDDREINRLLSGFLNDNGFSVISLFHGLEMTEVLEKNTVDLVLLDLMLPYKSGDRILSEIRRISTVPVIILSAKDTTQNKVDLLRLGADDYITKPFDLEEVLARIECCLRRSSCGSPQDPVLAFQNLALNTQERTVTAGGQRLILTAKEYGILKLLMEHPNKVFSKANLFESIWGEEYLCEDNTLNVHISNLRNKLKSACPDREYIDTVWGIGYRLHRKEPDLSDSGADALSP